MAILDDVDFFLAAIATEFAELRLLLPISVLGLRSNFGGGEPGTSAPCLLTDRRNVLLVW